MSEVLDPNQSGTEIMVTLRASDYPDTPNPSPRFGVVRELSNRTEGGDGQLRHDIGDAPPLALSVGCQRMHDGWWRRKDRLDGVASAALLDIGTIGKGGLVGYRGERGADKSWVGHSNVNIDNAIRAAVHASGADSGTTFVVGPIEVTTKGDPNVGGH